MLGVMRIDNTRFQQFIEQTQDIPLVSCFTGFARLVVNAVLAVHNVAMRALMDIEKNQKEREAYHNKHTYLLYLNLIEMVRGTMQLIPIIGAIWVSRYNRSTLYYHEYRLKLGLEYCDTSIAYQQGRYLETFKRAWSFTKHLLTQSNS